ncbi:MAG: GNAT family N-acetyltransferase [Candidatus Nanopelagicales bacterium]
MADRSVRLARTPDVDDLAAVQVAAWRAAYDGVLPSVVLDSLDPSDLALEWARAILTPPSGAYRVLVALEGDRVVGYAATSPTSDPDADPATEGELVALAVAPDAQRRGHGSRLLAAAADYLAGDGFTGAVTWFPAADEARRAFLESAGWGPDGAFRELDIDADAGLTVREVRLVTALA